MMKSYEEMAQSVLRRARTHRAEKRHTMRILAVGAACVCCAGLAVLLGIRMDRPEPSVLELNDTVVPTTICVPSDTAEPTTDTLRPPVENPRLVLLHTLGDGSGEVELRENVKLPYRTVIRLRDIAGVAEEDMLEIYTQEQAYIDELFRDCGKECLNSWGRFRGESVLITTVSAGSFRLRLKDVDAVESVRISVTDMGYMRLWGERLEGYWCIADGKHSIELDTQGLKQATRDTEGALALSWQISKQAADIIQEDPAVSLSAIEDTITITVTYRDGAQETCMVDMVVGDTGEVYAIYRGMDSQVA